MHSTSLIIYILRHLMKSFNARNFLLLILMNFLKPIKGEYLFIIKGIFLYYENLFIYIPVFEIEHNGA